MKKDSLKRLTSRTEFSVLLGLIILIVIMSIASPYFLTTANVFNVLSQISRYGIISVGMALFMITGGIDLSVGYVVGLSATMGAHMITNMHLPWPLVLILVLLLGALIGAVNGFFITWVNLPPFIVTLAMSKVLSGCILCLQKECDQL